MKIVPHDHRGKVDFGWLKSNHSFSFGDFYDPNKMGFGKLRVINDDIVAAGAGFGKHKHSNVEIVSIPLSGSLKHADSMGHEQEITAGEVQVMSAGTGIFHSEYNASQSQQVEFLQIWIAPNQLNIAPRYAQNHYNEHDMRNKFVAIVGPKNSGLSTWIAQEAWLYMGYFDAGQMALLPKANQQNGLYLFLIEGKLEMDQVIMSSRDAAEIAPGESPTLQINSKSKILIIETPLI